MASPSKTSIFAALAGNVGVGAVKLFAFFLSGSSSMMVESIHSAVDSLNQGLLLFGMQRSARPPDESHPFGYGLEAYFWTFVVGLLIFAAGGVASIYEGIQKIQQPDPVTHVPLSLAVLAVCMVFEVASLSVSISAMNKNRPALFRRRYSRMAIAQAIHFSPDPGIFEVLAEDVASIIGLVFAFFGVVGSAWFGWTYADGSAAIAIGVLLVLLAGIVVAETHSLLTGEGASRPIVEGLREIIQADPRVASVCAATKINVDSSRSGPRSGACVSVRLPSLEVLRLCAAIWELGPSAAGHDLDCGARLLMAPRKSGK